MVFKRLGKQPSGERLERIKNQPNYKNGKFYNIEPTAVSPQDVSFFTVLKAFIQRPASVTPSRELPNRKTNLKSLTGEKPTVVWFGHSSYYLTYNGYNILVDPVFSGNASPVKFFGKSFQGTNIYEAQDFPEIDLLLLTHDHYDHLDYQFLKELKPQVKKVVASLGVGEHLEYWGMEKEKIHELAWHEKVKIKDDFTITALPSRHFSGRSTKRFNTLWSSFVLQWHHYRIFVGGDSGYSSQFKKTGEEFGPFDIAFLECGQYSPYWPDIHMHPEETVLAAQDLKAAVLVPVHWGKFVLSIHPWNEPVKRLIPVAKERGQDFLAPFIGEAFVIGEEYGQTDWWNFENENYEK